MRDLIPWPHMLPNWLPPVAWYGKLLVIKQWWGDSHSFKSQAGQSASNQETGRPPNATQWRTSKKAGYFQFSADGHRPSINGDDMFSKQADLDLLKPREGHPVHISTWITRVPIKIRVVLLFAITKCLQPSFKNPNRTKGSAQPCKHGKMLSNQLGIPCSWEPYQWLSWINVLPFSCVDKSGSIWTWWSLWLHLSDGLWKCMAILACQFMWKRLC